MSRAKLNDTKRIPQDAYQTPVWCAANIITEVDWLKVKSFLEPCKGDENILKLVRKQKILQDILAIYYSEIKEGHDYLTDKWEEQQVDLIITNPPFSLALEFLEKSLQEARCVVYLLRLNFLGSRKRKEFWQKNSPTHLFVLSKRPSFTGSGTDATEYAWFCFDKAGIIKRQPGIYVI